MERRDLIKDQIEQFAKIIGQAVADLLGLKNANSILEEIQQTNEQLNARLGIDINDIITLVSSELKSYIIDQNMPIENIISIAHYIKEIGLIQQEFDNTFTITYLTRAKLLVDIADELSETFSNERLNQSMELSQLLAQIDNSAL